MLGSSHAHERTDNQIQGQSKANKVTKELGEGWRTYERSLAEMHSTQKFSGFVSMKIQMDNLRREKVGMTGMFLALGCYHLMS